MVTLSSFPPHDHWAADGRQVTPSRGWGPRKVGFRSVGAAAAQYEAKVAQSVPLAFRATRGSHVVARSVPTGRVPGAGQHGAASAVEVVYEGTRYHTRVPTKQEGYQRLYYEPPIAGL